jgi:hypothetical protein
MITVAKFAELYWNYFIIFFVLLVATASDASAEIVIVVAPEYRAIHYSASVKLKPGQIEVIDLHLNEAGDSYVVFTRTRSLSALLVVLDGRDRASNNLAPSPILNQSLSGQMSFNIARPPSKEGLIVVLANRSNSDIEVAIRIDRVGIRTPEIRDRVRDWVAIPFEALNSVYRLPAITITVRPCGQINAFSAPDIVICSELIADLIERNLANALHPILLHELAHSVLNIWNLPGYDNEDIADEFVAVLLAKLAPEILGDYIRWLERNDSIAEAVVQLVSGGRHTISVQRARNMQRIMRDPEPVMRRWNNLLSPYIRR